MREKGFKGAQLRRKVMRKAKHPVGFEPTTFEKYAVLLSCLKSGAVVGLAPQIEICCQIQYLIGA